MDLFGEYIYFYQDFDAAVAPVNVPVAGPALLQLQPEHVEAPTTAADESVQFAAPTLQPPTSVAQKPLNSSTEKCRNLLANLLELSSKEPQLVELKVRELTQGLINAEVQPEEYCSNLERLLNASPQPALIGFLKETLPSLRQALVTKELVINSISPPAAHVEFAGISSGTQDMSSTVMYTTQQESELKSGDKDAMAQNKPALTKVKAGKGKSKGVNNKGKFIRHGKPTAAPSNVIAPQKKKSLVTVKGKKPFTPPPAVDDMMADDDDIHDVVAMGGVNLAEESQNILGSKKIGCRHRSCKEEFLVPIDLMRARVKATCARHGLEPTLRVSELMNHALRERLMDIVEKLVNITNARYEDARLVGRDQDGEPSQIKRVTLRDLLFVLEQDKYYSRSLLLYCLYLK